MGSSKQPPGGMPPAAGSAAALLVLARPAPRLCCRPSLLLRSPLDAAVVHRRARQDGVHQVPLRPVDWAPYRTGGRCCCWAGVLSWLAEQASGSWPVFVGARGGPSPFHPPCVCAPPYASAETLLVNIEKTPIR